MTAHAGPLGAGNAAIHRSKKVLKALAQLGGRVVLHFLPPYDPSPGPTQPCLRAAREDEAVHARFRDDGRVGSAVNPFGNGDSVLLVVIKAAHRVPVVVDAQCCADISGHEPGLSCGIHEDADPLVLFKEIGSCHSSRTGRAEAVSGGGSPSRRPFRRRAHPGVNQSTDSGGSVIAAEAGCPSHPVGSVCSPPMLPMLDPPYCSASELSSST